MKRFIITFLGFILPHFMFGENIKLTLEEAVRYALGKNFSQQSLLIDKQVSKTELEQSKLELLPDLNANLSQNFTHTSVLGSEWSGNYGLSASLSLFEGGRNMNAIKMNKLLVQQSDSKIAQAQNNLATQVIQAFLEIIMNDELYQYLKTVETTSHEQMLQGETKWKRGQIIESDYLLLKAQAATDKFNVVNTETARENSLLKLKSLLSMTETETPEISIPSLNNLKIALDLPALNEVITRTFEWFPDLKISQQNNQLSALNIKQAKSAYLPSLSLGASLGSSYLGGNAGTQLRDKWNQQVGITLSIPIWDKGRTRSQVKQANYKWEQDKLSQKNTEIELRQQLEQEYNSVKAGYQKYVASEESAWAYSASAAAYRKQFELGQITAVELLQQETNYLSALNDYVQNKYSYLLNRKLIDVYMGVEIKL